jgi:hypothetical protein
MVINQDCPLILKDLYSYDIVSAYPSILKKQNFDFKGIDLDNKTERSVFLGVEQKGNINLSEFLLESVDSLMKYYLQENNVSDEEIITIQRDGCIIKKALDNNDEFIKLELRELIDFLILAPDRKKYLYSANGEVIIKGLAHYYDELDTIYKKFANFTFYDKSILFEQMEDLKQEILTTENKKLFLIPREENSFVVLTHKGDIQIRDPDFVSLSSIDRIKYYNHYFADFLRSIYLGCY